MPNIGKVFRIFNAKESEFYDDEVEQYLYSVGEDPKSYSEYTVVSKRLEYCQIALARYNKPACSISTTIWCFYQLAGQWLDVEFGPFVRGFRIWRYDEVLEDLDGSKSPGYPWTLKYASKCDYWLSDDASFFCKYYDSQFTANPIRVLCSTTIKVESRPTVKVLANKVRTITAMDVNHLVAQNMFERDYNKRLKLSVGKHSVCLGMSLLGGGAHRLIQRMDLWPGENTDSEDGKEFDGSFHTCARDVISDHRWRMRRIEDQTARNRLATENLARAVTDSPKVSVDGEVFACETGNNSGQGSTTEWNSLKNACDMSVRWMICTPAEMRFKYVLKQRYTRYCLVGDDIGETVHPCCHKYLTGPRKDYAGKMYGMTYTRESSTRKRFSDLTFMGHSFQKTTIPTCGWSMYLPIIDRNKMRCSMLIDNEFDKSSKVAGTIIRACGLRNETFADEENRRWFASLIQFLRDRYANSEDPKIKAAWGNYVSDEKLWKIYSGFDAVDVSNYQDSA